VSTVAEQNPPVANALRVVLYEGQGADALESTERNSLLNGLLDSGYAVTCARDGGTLSAPDDSPLMVLGRFHEGTAPAIADAEDRVQVFTQDIASLATEAVVERVHFVREQTALRVPGEWHPWFPVIDYDRCTNCMQCLSFCLFGVYDVSNEDKIQVRNEDQCKTNCPACSRVCPEAAIMFPKYRSGPVNGEEVSDEGVEREKMKVDISALLGGDIYQKLRDRSDQAKERFTKERDETVALKERKRCLVEMQKDMDIPMEALMSLPSPDEIQRRAAEAKQKADDAIARRMRDRDGNYDEDGLKE